MVKTLDVRRVGFEAHFHCMQLYFVELLFADLNVTMGVPNWC